MIIRKILKDWFTGVDGQTYDLGRSLWATVITAPIAIAGVQILGALASLLRRVPLRIWSAQDWAVWCGGISGLLLAGAGALYVKRGTEPSTTTSQTVMAKNPPTGDTPVVAVATENTNG